MDVEEMSERAEGTFRDIYDAERRLLQAAVAGTACQLAPGSKVRPALVRWLRTDPAAKKLVEQVWLDGFRYNEIRSAYTPYRRPHLAAFARRLGADPDAPKQRGWRRVLAPALALNETHLSLVRRHTQHTYDPQPYDALAAALRSMGREPDASKVLMAKANDGRRARTRRLLGLPYRLLVGNGYRTGRALVWVLAAVLLGAYVFGSAYDRGEIRPVKSANDYRGIS